jgi:hypothetical protein
VKLGSNQRGSVLQIVLVIFMILHVSVLSIAKIVLENVRAWDRIEQINTVRILELQFIYHVKQMARDEVLSDGSIHVEGGSVTYFIEKSDLLYINSLVEVLNERYAISLVLCPDTLRIKELSY